MPDTFTPAEIQTFAPAMKIGLVASVNDQGQPHVTLLSSLMACGERRLCWGQFTEGLSLGYMQRRRKVGFLIMNLARHLWRGKACYTDSAASGKEFEHYNNEPMFRYNAYFGVHSVHYFDLVQHGGEETLPMNRIIFSAVQTLLARRLASFGRTAEVFTPWTQRFVDKIDNLKFVAYLSPDGFPTIIPAIQLQTGGSAHLFFSTGAYGRELRAIPPGVNVAVFTMALSMEDVLMRGTYRGIQRRAGLPVGVIEVDWVYNPMPPTPEVIYPQAPLEAVREF